MAEVELRVTADLDQATKEVAGFSKAYADMVKQVEKPLRQVNATRDLEANLEATGKQLQTARQRLRDLQSELIRTDAPAEQLKESFREATKELQRLERTEAVQANQLRRMRSDLQGAGVDTSRLAAEQRRLNGELTSALGAGRNEAAARGIRERAAALKLQAVAQRQANAEAARENLGVNRYRALQLEIQAATRQYEMLRRSGRLTAQELGVAQQQLTRRIRESKEELQALAGASSGGGIAGLVGGGVGAAAGAIGVAGIAAMATQYATTTDAIKKMDAQLQLATSSQQEFSKAQAETFRIAQENQAPLTDVVTLYSRLAPALRDVGRGQVDAVAIIDAVTKSLRISGATAAETASTIQQFSQALGSGVLRGEEFNTLAESSPRLLRALADGLNTNVGALREMAAQGKLTADVISDALIGQLPKLTEEAAQLPETFGGAVTKLGNELLAAIGKLDEFTGASDKIIEKVNALSGAIRGLSSGSAEAAAGGVANLAIELARMVPLIDLAFGAADKAFGIGGLQKAAKDASEAAKAEAKVYDFREERLRRHAAVVRETQKQSATDSKKILDQQVEDTKAALKQQVDAERAAATELEKAKQAQVETQRRYKEALDKLNAGPEQEASYAQASALKAGARQAMQRGDVEEAKRQAQAALAVLQELAAAGENTYGFAGFIKELQAIEESADQRGIDDAQAKMEAAKQAVLETKKALEVLKDIKVAPTLDAEAQQALLNQLQQLAKQAGTLLTIPVTPVVAGSGGSVDPSVPAAATGGIFRGPGTGTSDSIWARVSNGEGILNARAVQHYGSGLVHQLNRLQVPKYAQGGVVGGLSIPEIPAVNPSLLGQGNQYLGDTTLIFPGGESLTVSVPTSQGDSLKNLRLKFGKTRLGR